MLILYGKLEEVRFLDCWADNNLGVIKLRVEGREFYKSRGDVNEKTEYVKSLKPKVGKRVKLKIEKVKDNIFGWLTFRFLGINHPIDYYEVLSVDDYTE